MSVEKMLKKGYKAVKQRWNTKDERHQRRQEEQYKKLSLEEARLDKKLRLRRLKKRVRQKKMQTSPLGRLLQEPEKSRKSKNKRRKKKKAPKKKAEKGFTLPQL